MKMTKYSISRRRRGRGRGRGRSRGRGRGRNNTAKKSVIKKGGGVQKLHLEDILGFYDYFITKRHDKGGCIRIDLHMVLLHGNPKTTYKTTKLSVEDALDAKFDFFDEDDQNYITEIEFSHTIDDAAAQEELFKVVNKMGFTIESQIDKHELIKNIKKIDFTNARD